MKKNKVFIKTIGAFIVGFGCGFVVDSMIFHIDPVFCGIIEGILLGGISCALELKNNSHV